MKTISRARLCWLAALTVLPVACSGGADDKGSLDSSSQETNTGYCKIARPHDVLIAGLVKDSWTSGYPLTLLSVDASGSVVGPNLPTIVAGDLEVINSVAEARTSLGAAVVKFSGLPEYGIQGVGPDASACSAVPAWTPDGTSKVATGSVEMFTNGVNESSWDKVIAEIATECPLVRRSGDRDLVSPPPDGSTNEPASESVSATGVVANAFGLCPVGTAQDSHCKLSYATGANYAGRKCQSYGGNLRCLLY